MHGRKRSDPRRRSWQIAATLALTLPHCSLHAETLRDALLRSYATNPDLTAARAQLRAIDENVGIAKAAGRPQLAGSGAFSQTNDDFPHFRDRGRSLSAELGGSYTIYAGGRVRNAVHAADARVIAGRADLRQTEGDVFAQVIAAYMGVIRDAYIVRLNEGNVQLLEADFTSSQARFKGGDLTRTDVAQSEARLADARSQLEAAQGSLTASGEEYRRVTGAWPVALEPPPPLPPLPRAPDDAVMVGLDDAPSLASISASAKAAAFDVASAEAQRLPIVAATATATYTNYLHTLDKVLGYPTNAGLDQVQTTSVVGVTATIPIYQGGGPAAQIRQAKELRSEAEEQTIAAERLVISSVRTAFSSYRVASATITSSQTAVSANRLAVQGAREEQRAGERTILDVLNAQQELLTSQVALVAAQRDQYVAGATLLNAMGHLSTMTLGLEGGPLYDPEPNYERASHSISDWNVGKDHTPAATRTIGATPSGQPLLAPGRWEEAPVPATVSETITRPQIDPVVAPNKPSETHPAPR